LKTPFEFFKDKKPNLRHVRVWKCPFKVRTYTH